MDERFERGKIYTIRCRTDETLIYVGATIETRLCARFSKHKADKTVSLYKYVNDPKILTTWKDWYIELHELYPCTCKMELGKREGEVIREIGTINKNGYGTPETIKENQKIYRDNHKEHKKIYNDNHKEHNHKTNKVYRDNHKEDRKKYKDANKENQKEYQKIYQEKNKERIAAYQKIYHKNKKMENLTIQ